MSQIAEELRDPDGGMSSSDGRDPLYFSRRSPSHDYRFDLAAVQDVVRRFCTSSGIPTVLRQLRGSTA